MPQDPYEILGVSRSASPEEIKKAYRKLVRQYHPDINKEDGVEDKFKEINAAYEILSDEEKRARFDRFGMAGMNGGAGGFDGAFTGDLGDIFEQFFGGMGGFSSGRGGTTGRRQPRQGRDLRADMTITFEESIFGCEKPIDITRQETCDVCNGSGAEPGTSPKRCTECNGAGEVRQVRQTFLGSMVTSSTCPRCNGRGEIIETPCKNCRGTGQNRKTRTLTIKVPPGIDDGMRIRRANEGEPGENGGPNGNLQVFIKVQPHEIFRRRENDILLDIQLNVAQAALGASLTVPTVDGDEQISIPAGTQSGKVIRLRGHGAPRVRSDGSSSGRGDELVVVQVQVPTQLSAEQRRLFEELSATFGTSTKAETAKSGKGFFERVADFLSGEG
jgi:molecular chaperone DnaJ